MTPFLQQVVRHYFSAGDISRRKFIFPNRRSQVFFTKYLGEEVKASGTPVVAPGMMTINDFFYTLSGFRATDRVTLLLELYDCYKELFQKAEPLDEFVFWGDVLLGDFDDVDKYLVDPGQLYTNVADLRAIQDSYSYLTETQRKAIESFVQHFRDSDRLTVDPDSDNPNVKERFFQIWQILLPLYRNFRKSLMVTRPTKAGRISLSDRRLRITENGAVTERHAGTPAELEGILRQEFGIAAEIPGERFAALRE